MSSPKSLGSQGSASAPSWLFIWVPYWLMVIFATVDAPTNGVETITRFAMFGTLFIFCLLTIKSMNPILVAGVLSLAVLPSLFFANSDLGPALFDLLQFTAFVALASTTLSIGRSRRRTATRLTFATHLPHHQWRLVAGIAAFPLFFATRATDNIRGEVPPIALLAIGAALINSPGDRWYSRALGFAAISAYGVVGIIGGYRSSVLLLLVVGVFTLFRTLATSANSAWRMALAAALVLCLFAIGSSISVLFESSIPETRALTFGDGTATVGSNQSRSAELRSALSTATSGSLPEILLGRGFGASATDGAGSRVVHNVWANLVVRHGILGLVISASAHWSILRRVARSVRSEMSTTSMFISLGGLLVLIDAHLRFTWSDPATIFLMALAVSPLLGKAARPSTRSRAPRQADRALAFER